MSKKLTITIHVNPAAAVRAGRTVCGACEVVLSDEDLAQLTPEQRETLAKHVDLQGLPAPYCHWVPNHANQGYGFPLGDKDTSDASIETLAHLLDKREEYVRLRCRQLQEEYDDRRAQFDAEVRKAIAEPLYKSKALDRDGQFVETHSGSAVGLVVEVPYLKEIDFRAYSGRDKPLSDGLRAQYEAAQKQCREEAERLRLAALPQLQALLAEREATEAANQAEYNEQYVRLPQALRERREAGYATVEEVSEALQALWRADAGLGEGCVEYEDWYDEEKLKTLTDEQFEALQALRQRLPEGFEAEPVRIFPERAYRAATEEDDPSDVDADGEVRIPQEERKSRIVAVVSWQRTGCDVHVVLPLD